VEAYGSWKKRTGPSPWLPAGEVGNRFRVYWRKERSAESLKKTKPPALAVGRHSRRSRWAQTRLGAQGAERLTGPMVFPVPKNKGSTPRAPSGPGKRRRLSSPNPDQPGKSPQRPAGSRGATRGRGGVQGGLSSIGSYGRGRPTHVQSGDSSSEKNGPGARDGHVNEAGFTICASWARANDGELHVERDIRITVDGPPRRGAAAPRGNRVIPFQNCYQLSLPNHSRCTTRAPVGRHSEDGDRKGMLADERFPSSRCGNGAHWEDWQFPPRRGVSIYGGVDRSAAAGWWWARPASPWWTFHKKDVAPIPQDKCQEMPSGSRFFVLLFFCVVAIGLLRAIVPPVFVHLDMLCGPPVGAH